MSGQFFDDDQEIDPLTLAFLRRMLADLLRERGEAWSPDEQLALAKELVALYKSGFEVRQN